jgi:hypothetical protein
MMSVRYTLAVIAAVAGLLSAGGVTAEPVTFTKDAPLRSEARFDAAPVTQVKQGTVGDATGKQGPWLNIKVPAGTGWALTTDISFGTGAASGGSGASVGSIFGPRRPQATTTATIGIRGFDKETIGNAFGEGGTVSASQLAMLDKYAVDKAAGQSFASAQGLTASSVSY